MPWNKRPICGSACKRCYRPALCGAGDHFGIRVARIQTSLQSNNRRSARSHQSKAPTVQLLHKLSAGAILVVGLRAPIFTECGYGVPRVDFAILWGAPLILASACIAHLVSFLTSNALIYLRHALHANSPCFAPRQWLAVIAHNEANYPQGRHNLWTRHGPVMLSHIELIRCDRQHDSLLGYAGRCLRT